MSKSVVFDRPRSRGKIQAGITQGDITPAADTARGHAPAHLPPTPARPFLGIGTDLERPIVLCV